MPKLSQSWIVFVVEAHIFITFPVWLNGALCYPSPNLSVHPLFSKATHIVTQNQKGGIRRIIVDSAISVCYMFSRNNCHCHIMPSPRHCFDKWLVMPAVSGGNFTLGGQNNMHLIQKYNQYNNSDILLFFKQTIVCPSFQANHFTHQSQEDWLSTRFIMH